jgi:hypothetical protein
VRQKIPQLLKETLDLTVQSSTRVEPIYLLQRVVVVEQEVVGYLEDLVAEVRQDLEQVVQQFHHQMFPWGSMEMLEEKQLQQQRKAVPVLHYVMLVLEEVAEGQQEVL